MLRESNLASTEVLDALRSRRDVPRILKLLQEHKDLVDIADITSISQFTQSSVGSPPAVKVIKEETCGSCSIQEGLELTSNLVESWTSAPENQLDETSALTLLDMDSPRTPVVRHETLDSASHGRYRRACLHVLGGGHLRRSV